MNYMMATVASCEPSYTPQALKHVASVRAELKAKTGASVRFGVMETGERVGSLVLFQNHEELNGIDQALKVYAESANYQSIITSGKVHVCSRNIVKLEALQLQNPSSDKAGFGVTTRFASSDPMMDRIEQLVPVFEENGAMVLRYGTLVTGENAGKRFLGVTYRSMDAIEKTYNALRATDAYNTMLVESDLEMRNIIRMAG